MAMQETTVGSMNYNVLRNLILQCQLLKNNCGAEIGVLTADTSTYLLSELPTLTLFCVDPWVAYDEFEPERTQAGMSRDKEIAHSRLSHFGSRAKVIEATSTEAAPLIEDGLLDFVFIDALHLYQAVKDDLAAWYPKVRAGGMVAGHDYRWTGVDKAVQEFSEQSGLTGYFTPPSSDVWFFLKP